MISDRDIMVYLLFFITWMIILACTGCAKPEAAPFEWDWTPVENEPLDWSKPQHLPPWTLDEDWELRNHNRLPKKKFA